MSEETPPAPPPAGTKITFEHKFFNRVDDIYFHMDDATHEAVASVSLGEEHVALPLAGISREFGLEGTADGNMLQEVGKGLRYVQVLRLGDPLPLEIINRKASWEPQPRHKQIAYHRLSIQLLGWLSGDEHVITDPDELLQVAGDPIFRKKINDAFAEAAEQLGLGRQNKEKVTHIIAELAHELAYIEAMRDQFKQMEDMDHKIQELRRLYGTSRTVLEQADPCARLMERALAQFRLLFDQADAQTGEIMSVLKNIDRQKAFIQDIRDDLHIRLMAWREILDRWHHQPIRRSVTVEHLLADTYHFLAPRYMPVDEWVMMTKLVHSSHPRTDEGDSDQSTAHKIKRLGGTMEWL